MTELGAPIAYTALAEGVDVLKLSAAECEQLPDPEQNPAVLDVDGGDKPPSKLQRAWDLLSGRY